MKYKHKVTGNIIEFHTNDFEAMLKREGFEAVTEEVVEPVKEVETVEAAPTEEVKPVISSVRKGRPRK